MGTAIVAVLPFAPGLLLSPLPPVAASVLTIAPDGRRRAQLFALGWCAALLAGCLAAGVLLRLATAGDRLPAGAARTASVLLAAALVAVALVHGYGHVTGRGAPSWLGRVGTLPTRRAGPFAARLLYTDPMHLLLVGAAAVALAGVPADWPADLAAAALLAAAGTAGVAVPLIVSYAAGWTGSVRLHALRRTPVGRRAQIAFWLSAGYAAFLLT